MVRDPLAVLTRVSAFLRDHPDAITEEQVLDVMAVGVRRPEAYAMLLAARCGLDLDAPGGYAALRAYFMPSVREMDADAPDPYRDAIRMPNRRVGRFALCDSEYQPYEAFVTDDIVRAEDGMLLPRIGYYPVRYAYPALLEGDTLWMSVTPSEVITLRRSIERAHGRALTYGMGLGYYPFMVSQKDTVRDVTIVERSPEVIELFKKYLLPQFPHKEKIIIVQADAFKFARERTPAEHYDAVMADLWHSVADGLEMYKTLKPLEALCPGTTFDYWLEPSMKLYQEAFDWLDSREDKA